MYNIYNRDGCETVVRITKLFIPRKMLKFQNIWPYREGKA
jgi:hypothetical protein